MSVRVKNIIGHFATITHHRHQVIVHSIKAGIFLRGLCHDLSKYSPSEFFAGVKYYAGDRSPNEGERHDKGFSSAWLHHKGRNKHHFEYWCDYNVNTQVMTPVPMPIKYVAEMFCDRVAASKIYQGKNYTQKHPLEYFMRGKKTRSIHPDTSDLLESWLTILAEQGEYAAFEEIRKSLKRSKLS